MAIACAILNYFYKDTVIIISTGVTGAYMAIRAVSFVFGGFPSEMQIYHILLQNDYDKVT